MALTFDEARHLLARTGVGGRPNEIRALTSLDHAAAVSQLLDRTHRQALTPPPPRANTLPPPPERYNHMSPEERHAFREVRKAEGLKLKQWWYRKLPSTPSALTERMTLLWHDHFTTSSLPKVHWTPFLYRQNLLLRAHALGSFRDLLVGTAKGQALIRYLDTQSNHKDRPNEN